MRHARTPPTVDGPVSHIVITVRLSDKERNAVISVENSGGMIPARDLPEVFERLYQVDGHEGVRAWD